MNKKIHEIILVGLDLVNKRFTNFRHGWDYFSLPIVRAREFEGVSKWVELPVRIFRQCWATWESPFSRGWKSSLHWRNVGNACCVLYRSLQVSHSGQSFESVPNCFSTRSPCLLALPSLVHYQTDGDTVDQIGIQKSFISIHFPKTQNFLLDFFTRDLFSNE